MVQPDRPARRNGRLRPGARLHGRTPVRLGALGEHPGRARQTLKRAWVSPQGNIAVTIVLYPARKNLHFLTMLASLAVLHSIEKTTGLKCQLKLPNDVLVNNKKVCGILLESQASSDSVDYAIVGIGINVNMKPWH